MAKRHTQLFPGTGDRRPPDLFEASANLSKALRLRFFEWMATTRKVEARMGTLYRQGKVVGGLYRGEGQEGISVGTAMALKDGDIVGPMIRDLGTMIVRGVPPRDVFCQYMARADGPTGGRDCNTHFGDHGLGITAPISMLGALIPVVSGMAWAAREQGKNVVGLTYIGDGGASCGDFHEGLNMAATLGSPLVLVLENNGYAYSTPVADQSKVEWFVDRAAGYGVRGMQVDGNDVEAVYAATLAACEHARSGKGPVLIEAISFRMNGHAEHDDASYVPEALVKAWRRRDPIELQRKRLIDAGIKTARQLENLEDRLFAQLKADVEFALASAMPDPLFATGGVTADDPIGVVSPRRQGR
jgi:pyruvate dehydrogenase E1 component alpha subunit/2-oxoisovalerate dehydrogenase E1 component alpha subunit